MRCDLCNVECDPDSTPAWTYKTVNTVGGPDDPSLPMGMGFWAEDEEWLVCIDCHLLIERRADVALLARSIAMQDDYIRAQGLGRLSDEHKKEVARIHSLFWVHKSIQPPVAEHRA